ncbi:putative transposase of the Rover3 hAT-like family [Lachancea sp. 'fantastica']|nr:putative transposase of the Rover3 hAT-like family [Lachancea sp. 'fantastica']
MSSQLANNNDNQAQKTGSDMEGESASHNEASNNDQHDAATPASDSKASRWMARSKMRSHFKISKVDGMKIATCIYCGRAFQESKSTGNLSKHIKNLHATEFRAQKAQEPRERISDTIGLRSLPIPLPDTLVFEIEQNPGAFMMVALITEKLLPFCIVESTTFRWMGNLMPEMSFIQSRTTVSDKVETYTKGMDEGLISAMQKTDFINLELNIWTGFSGRSYLGISASFAPSLLDNERLNSVGPMVLHNRLNGPCNSHLLDLVDITETPQTGEFLFETLSSTIKRFKIEGKIGSITSDTVANSIFKNLTSVCNLIKPLRSKQLIQVEVFHHIQCASHILNGLFEIILKTMSEDDMFQKGLQNITELARIVKRSSLAKDSLAIAKLPQIPSAHDNAWFPVWNQIAKYLEHYDKYLEWFEDFRKSSDHQKAASKMAPHVQLSPDTRNILEYFVHCCSIFKYLNDSLLNESFNQLPNAISFYYTMKEFFDLCANADVQGIKPPSEGCFDFTFINGKESLSRKAKNTVLSAVLSARPKFTDYFESFWNNELYFVAAFLDPTSKVDSFSQLLDGSDREHQLQKVETYIKHYLAQCQPKMKQSSLPSPPLQSQPAKSYKVYKIPRLDRREKKLVSSSVATSLETMEEWEKYKSEGEMSANSVNDVLEWWHSRRFIYPNLFPLAVSLVFTRFNTCGMEQAFSKGGAPIRKDRFNICSADFRKVMTLRSRFYSFGLFEDSVELASNSDADRSITNTSDSGDLFSDE